MRITFDLEVIILVYFFLQCRAEWDKLLRLKKLAWRVTFLPHCCSEEFRKKHIIPSVLCKHMWPEEHCSAPFINRSMLLFAELPFLGGIKLC